MGVISLFWGCWGGRQGELTILQLSLRHRGHLAAASCLRAEFRAGALCRVWSSACFQPDAGRVDSRVGIDYVNSAGFRELARGGNASPWLTLVFGRRSCDTCNSFGRPRGFLAGRGPSFAATPGMKAPHQAGLTFQMDGSFGFFASPSRNNVPGGNI